MTSKPNNQPDQSSWWNWGSNVLGAVTATSKEILNVYKEDIIQFKDIVTNDTKKIIDDNRAFLEKEGATGIKNKISEGVSTGITILTDSITNFDLSKLTTNFTTPNEIETDLDKRIKQLQQDPKTFSTEPEDPEFIQWKSQFDLNQYKSETQSILSTNSEIFLIYSRLVPESISPQDFWERYFYRLKLHKAEEDKKIALLKGSAPAVTQLTWDDEFEEEKPLQSSPPNEKTPLEDPKGPIQELMMATNNDLSSQPPEARDPLHHHHHTTVPTDHPTTTINNNNHSPQADDSSLTETPNSQIQKSDSNEQNNNNNTEEDKTDKGEDWLDW